VRPDDNVVFLATGTGEAPHNYMLWELLRRGHTGHILSACCVRYRRDLGYVATHEELMRRYPNYTYLSLTTREADTVKHKVYIQDLITSGQLEERLGAPLDPARTHVYLCGNPKMIGVPVKDRETGERSYPQPAGVIEILERRGFQADQAQPKVKGNIHFEEYW
jgi:ferredoxin--NADP+ reductase